MLDTVIAAKKPEPTPPAASKKPEPANQANAAKEPDRAVAEWVLSVSGWVQIRVGDKEILVTNIKDIPQAGFQLEHVRFLDQSKFSEGDLAKLKGLQYLQSVDLGATPVTDAGLVHVAELKNLTALKLGPGITDAGLKHVTALQNLTSLGFYGETKVTGPGLAQLKALPKLSILGINVSSLRDADLAYIAELENLRVLEIGATPITGAGLVHVAKLKNLQTLTLTFAPSAPGTSDEGLRQLAKLENLKNLQLIGDTITDAGFAHLRGLKNLRALALRSSGVTDAGLVNLQGMKTLQNLDLGNTMVTDAGMARLTGLKDLRGLVLFGSRVTDAGLPHLAGLPSLGELDLAYTRVTDAGLKHLAAMPQLELLDLYGTRVSAAGIATLRQAAPKLNPSWSEPNRNVAEKVIKMGGHVHIRVEGAPADRQVKAVGELPTEYFRATRISLAGVKKHLDADIWLWLGSLSDPQFDRLDSLDLTDTTSVDWEPRHLGALTSLSELVLTRAYLYNEPLKLLKGLTLRRLVLDGAKAGHATVADRNLPDLKELPDLTDLVLAHTQVTDAGLIHLAALKKLKRLDLDGSLIKGTGLGSLKDLPELKELRLGCPTFTHLFADNLGVLKQVEKLSLAGSSISDAGLKSLNGLTNLQELDLSNTKVSAQCIAELQKALPKCKIIQSK